MTHSPGLNKSRLILSLRVGEIALMSGFFVIGSFFTGKNPWQTPGRFLLMSAGIIAYIAAVYMLNSFADYDADEVNPRLKPVRTIARNTYLKLTVITVCLFLAVFAFLDFLLILISLTAFFGWVLYYVYQFKGVPYAGTVIHFFAGILHFHMGYAAFSEPGPDSIAVSLYFALILCAGHINHELIDFEADSRAGVMTTAVKIGEKSALRNLMIVFAASLFAGIFISAARGGSDTMFFLFPAASTLSLVSAPFFRNKKPRQFRFFYRSVFATAGIIYIVSSTI